MAGSGVVPGVDVCLQFFAPGEQRGIVGREAGGQRREIRPETVRVEPGAGKRLLFDEACEARIDGQAVAVKKIGPQNTLWSARLRPVHPGEERVRRPMAPLMRDGTGRLVRTASPQHFPPAGGRIRISEHSTVETE